MYDQLYNMNNVCTFNLLFRVVLCYKSRMNPIYHPGMLSKYLKRLAHNAADLSVMVPIKELKAEDKFFILEEISINDALVAKEGRVGADITSRPTAKNQCNALFSLDHANLYDDSECLGHQIEFN